MRTSAIAILLLALAGCSTTPGGNAGSAPNAGTAAPAASGAAPAANPGATGAASERYMGVRSNVNATWNGSTSSSTMLEQRIKEDSARGAASGGGDTKY